MAFMVSRIFVMVIPVTVVAWSVSNASIEGKNSKMAAVNQVLEMMQSLRTQVLQEGETEAATYNKFACFCKDTTRDRLDSIQTGEDEKSELDAAISSMDNERSAIDSHIAGYISDIAGYEFTMKSATAVRHATLKEYQTNSADLKSALDSLAGAVKTLKASKSPSMLQMQSVSETVRTASMLADALGLSTTGAKALFLQDPENKVQMQDYDFHSHDIIETLETLNADFIEKRNQVSAEEVKSVSAYDMTMQDLTHSKETAVRALDQKRKDRSKTIEDIATASQEVSTVSSTLIQDKEYTNELSKMCSDKAKTWDQRTSVRANELATLSEVITIISTQVAGNTTANTIRFVQGRTSLRLAKFVAANAGAMDDIEAAAEEADATPSFLQAASNQHGRLRASVRRNLGVDNGRDAVISALRQQGEHLKSTLLTALASKIAADPFSKVKQLIQELIERLLQEEANEANQKGWCDKATADASQKRRYAADTVRSLNGDLAKLNALVNRLQEQWTVLDGEVTDLSNARATAVSERTEESKQNDATVKEADEGMNALDMAITILDRFYKTASKSSVDLSLEQQPAGDAPDAGFKIDEAYTGAQSEAGGILGMLEVMKSDFRRTIEETNKAEDQAEQDHIEFMTQSGKSLAQKEEAKGQTLEQHSAASTKYSDALEQFESQVDIMNGAIQELLDLKPVCVDTGMTYNDRVSRREDEIEALNKALCIFGNYAEYGPDGAGKGC